MASDLSWASDVFIALSTLGGKARLADIYESVYRQRFRRGDTIGDRYDATVRNILHSNSNGKGHDLFVHLGRTRSGVWGLKHMHNTNDAL